MPGEEPAPVLQDAFDALGTSLEDMLKICQSKSIPTDIMDQAKGQSSDWDEADIAAELTAQCEGLLPGLLAEKKAAEDAAAEEKKVAEDEKKAAAAAKKKQEDEKKAAAAAQKKKEDEQKAKEKAKRDEEEKKKKQAAAEKKAAEDKKKKAEEDKKKAEQKKKDDAEKAKQQAAAKKKKEEEDKKKKAAAEQKKKEDEQKKKEKEAADKKKEAEKAKEKAAVAEKKQEDEEKKKKEQEEKKKKKGGGKKEEKKEEKKKSKKEDKREEKKHHHAKKGEKKADNSEEEWDEETGKMVQKKVPHNHRSKVADPGCGCTDGGGNGCRAFAFITYFLVFPAVFAALVFMEYESHGWVRVMDRSAAQNPDCFPGGPKGPKLDLPQCDDDGGGTATRRFLLAAAVDAVAAAGADSADGADGGGGEPSPTEPPLSKSKAFAGFVKANPYSWIMPLIGLAMGLFNNFLPIAGGLVLMPLLEELEITTSSEETLALACMAQVVNSGVLGFVAWCARDVRLFVCRALFMLVPMAWFGYLVGTTNNLSFKDLLIAVDKEVDDPGFRDTIAKSDVELLHTYIRLGFGAFMCVMSIFVLIGCCIGGMNRFCCPSYTGGTTPGCKSFCQWIIVWACTFNTGWLLVANVGAGMGMSTFFLLSVFLGVEHKRAMPTAIVCGAWTAVLPAFSNWVALGGGTYVRLMMMTPGMWFGALLAPWFSKCGGPMCDLIMFFFALAVCGIAVTGWAALKLQAGEEDVDIDINPIYHVAFVDEWFMKKRSEVKE